MPTIFDYDLVAALGRPGCPLCRVLARDEVRRMDTFVREGRMDGDLRLAFYAGGGFCNRHAWLFHERVTRGGSGAPVADIYGSLANKDLERLGDLSDRIAQGRRPKREPLRRAGGCVACVATGSDLERKAAFFALALNDAEVRDRYASSDGLCFSHLVDAIAAAESNETALFLLRDWSRRLAALRDGLAEYDRKRDYRYADEPKGAEQSSWTDVIRRYVGDRRD